MRDIILSASVMILGIAAFLQARTFPLGKTLEMQPGFYPQILGILLFILGAILLIRASQKVRKEDNEPVRLQSFLKPLVVLSLTAGYWLLLYLIGFILSTITALLAMVLLFGGTKRQALAAALVGTPVFYLVFRFLFEVPLPRGLLELI